MTENALKLVTLGFARNDFLTYQEIKSITHELEVKLKSSPSDPIVGREYERMTDLQKRLDHTVDRMTFCLGNTLPKGFVKRWEKIFYDGKFRGELAKAQQDQDVESNKLAGLVQEVDVEMSSNLKSEKELHAKNEKVEGASWEDMTKNIKWLG